MSNAERTLGIVPLVFAEDGGGYAVPAKCSLCGIRIAQRDLCYGRLPSDPAGLSRPLHAKCKREYEVFTLALGL